MIPSRSNGPHLNSCAGKYSMASLRRTLVAALAVLSGIASASPASDLVPRQQAASPLLREVFQVAQPILGPDGPLDSWGRDRVKVADTAQKRQENAACQVQLMEYSFASSYGEPFVGKFGEQKNPAIMLCFTELHPMLG